MARTQEWLEMFNASVEHVKALGITVTVIPGTITISGNEQSIIVPDDEYMDWFIGSVELCKELGLDDNTSVLLYFAYDYIDALYPDSDV